MKLLLTPINRNWDRISFRLLRARKAIYRLPKIREMNGRKTVLFIIGCQRSGTTLMTRIFEEDFNTKIYDESSVLSSHDIVHKIRLNPLHIVKTQIGENKAPLIVLKPLVETQNILKLLDYFESSKALWMYRNFRDVALSNLKRWGMKNGINNLRPIVEGHPHNWRSENISEYSRKLVIKFFSEDMNPYDAAALFWFARNQLFFELKLDKHPQVMMARYEDLITAPRQIMQRIYEFIGCEYPSDEILAPVRPEVNGKGKTIKLSPNIELLCKELFDKLNRLYESKYYHVHPGYLVQ
jgi:hypothetical protein